MIQMMMYATQQPVATLQINQYLERRLELMQVLSETKYTPRAVCPTCSYELSPREILQGFRDDPHDFTTCCPKPECVTRFEARLWRYVGANSNAEINFLCAVQTTARLTSELAGLSQEVLRSTEPSLYFSALTHFGTLQRAFAAANLDYPHQEIRDWQDKVSGFLGQLPDAIIAECAGVTIRRVRELRHTRNIPPYRRAPQKSKTS